LRAKNEDIAILVPDPVVASSCSTSMSFPFAPGSSSDASLEAQEKPSIRSRGDADFLHAGRLHAKVASTSSRFFGRLRIVREYEALAEISA